MRQSKVVGFSIPPEIHERFERVLKTKHKTRSEFFREILDTYFSRTSVAATVQAAPTEGDIAHALKVYWQLKSMTPSKVVIVGSAIVSRNGQVLIGARKEKDAWVDNLSWTFPGGRMETLSFDAEIVRNVKEKTGLDVDVKGLVTARVHPDAGFKDVQIVILYFHCVATHASFANLTAKAKNGFSKLKWVKPSDVFKYFTTSVTDDVTRFLLAIEKGE